MRKLLKSPQGFSGRWISISCHTVVSRVYCSHTFKVRRVVSKLHCSISKTGNITPVTPPRLKAYHEIGLNLQMIAGFWHSVTFTHGCVKQRMIHLFQLPNQDIQKVSHLLLRCTHNKLTLALVCAALDTTQLYWTLNLKVHIMPTVMHFFLFTLDRLKLDKTHPFDIDTQSERHMTMIVTIKMSFVCEFE